MRVGYFSTNASTGIRPDVLGRELEQRGFDSLWLPEHSHIPVDRVPVPPFGANLPDAYPYLMDPFVSLAMAATATSTLLLGTGVCMVLEHDVLDLACRVATLDVLAEGRLRFGVGVGWLREELANHRPDVPFDRRYSAVAERVAALRGCWVEEEAAFDGRWDRFASSWVYPKPLQQPLPVGFGCSGPVGMTMAAQHADEWMPIDVALARQGGVGHGIEEFRSLLVAAGRDPETVPITLFVWGWEPGDPSMERLAEYAELSVERLVVLPASMARHDATTTRQRLDEFQPFLDAISS